jgi:hypothetical protein
MENIFEDEIVNAHGKLDQQKSIKTAITDEQLEGFIKINFEHVSLPRGENQDKDVSLITWYTQKKFMVAIDIFVNMGVLDINKPTVLPYILNIVNEKSPRIPLQPAKFKGMLYPPQASLIKRMIDIETSSNGLILPSSKNPEQLPKTIKINGGIISERLSFGKTFCIPALICESLIPSTPPINCTSTIYCIDNEIIEEDILIKKVQIRTNLIVCGTKVSKEWKNNLKNFTTLNFQIVEKASDLDNLVITLKTEYPEIVVVKDGDVTWKGTKAKALEHTLGLDKFQDIIFSRVIYDDFDMLKLKKGSEVPDTLFTWFVSGTDNENGAQDLKFRYFSNDITVHTTTRQLSVILDAISSVKCNREYSITEYNIPQIDSYYVHSDVLTIVQNIINKKKVLSEGEPTIHVDKKLFGYKNVPYVYDKNNMKILVALENKQDQISAIGLLNDANIKTVKLTRANVDKFSREDAKVCVSGNLFGVNMGFLTHIIVDAEGFTQDGITQIIGRGQRLSRKQNLQVYFQYNSKFESGESGSL